MRNSSIFPKKSNSKSNRPSKYIFFSFRLCDPVEKSINNVLDIANLFESLASNFAGVVQYNKDNSPHATITIDDVCEIMVNTSIGAQVDRLAQVNTLLLNQSKEKCLDYKYDNMINEMKNTSWNSDVANGSKYLICVWSTNFFCIFLFFTSTQLSNGLIKRAMNSVFIKRLTKRKTYSAIASLWFSL